MTENEPKTADKPSFINKAADVLAYPISAAAGIYTFVSSVDDKLYDTLKKNISSLETKLNSSKTEFQTEIEKNVTKTSEELQKFHGRNSDIYKNELKSRKIDSFWKKLKGIHSDQRTDAAIIAFTAAGIGLGVLLTIANSKGLMDKINAKEKEKNPDAQAVR